MAGVGGGRSPAAASPANRGRALEDLVRAANARYRALGLAVAHKALSAWVPLRGPGGRIAGAKVEEKAAVDFLGHVRPPSGGGWGVPVAFDAKKVSRGDRWPLSRLEPHQYECLRDCHRTAGTGPSSVRAGRSELNEVRFPDYLDFVLSAEERVRELFSGKRGDQRCRA